MRFPPTHPPENQLLRKKKKRKKTNLKTPKYKTVPFIFAFPSSAFTFKEKKVFFRGTVSEFPLYYVLEETFGS